MRWLITVLTLALIAVQPACPTKSGGGGADKLPASARAYEALRWVPADVSYAVVGKTAADISGLLRELVEIAGIVIPDVDARTASEASKSEFGYDVLSPESLHGIGIDPGRGAAMFSTGLSLTVVAALSDPAALDAFVERMREMGVSLQSRMDGDVEVFTVNFEGDFDISWAAVDGWVLARMEFLGERAEPLAWLTEARNAAGGLAAHADFTAALEAARTHAIDLGPDGPPLVGVVRPGRLVDVVAALASREGFDIEPCAAPFRNITRVLMAAAITDAGAGGTMVADLADPTVLSSRIVAAPVGYYSARVGAPIQLDLGIDLPSAAQIFRECAPPDPMLQAWGIRTAHVAIHEFDDVMPARAIAYADLTTDRALRAQLGRIPLLGRFSEKRTVSSIEVVDVSVPMVPDFTYHLSSDRAVVGMGSGMIEKILDFGVPPASEIFHAEVRPHDVPVESWDYFLELALGVDRAGARQHSIQQLRRWDHGLVDIHLDGSRVILRATGTLHR